MRPGLALQQLTTREPTLDQLEVAIASLRAVMTRRAARRGRGTHEHRARVMTPAFRGAAAAYHASSGAVDPR